VISGYGKVIPGITLEEFKALQVFKVLLDQLVSKDHKVQQVQQALPVLLVHLVDQVYKDLLVHKDLKVYKV
jgi:hypothetical protein